MAAGIPVVASKPIADQMNLNDTDFAVAHTGEEFIEQISKLYCDPAQWTSTRNAGYEYVHNNFKVERFRNSIENAIEHLRSVLA